MKISIKPAFLIILTMWIYHAQAQENLRQVGFRFGNTTGFTARFVTEENFALEGILGFRNGGIQLYGLFEARKQLYLNRTDNMFLYFGGGLHLGYVRWNEYDEYYDPYHNYYDDYYDWHYGFAAGIDGILGMEYAFESAPITLAVDFKPFFEFYGPFLLKVNFWDFGFHIRYNF